MYETDPKQHKPQPFGDVQLWDTIMNTKKKDQKVRAYPLTNQANKVKLEQVREMLLPWRSALGSMQVQLMRAMLEGEPLSKRMSTKATDLSFTTILSARQVKSVYNQIFAALESWHKLLQNSVRELITGSTLDSETKTILYRVNKRSGWYAKSLFLPILVDEVTGEISHNTAGKLPKGWVKEELEVSPVLLKLLRHMVKQARNNGTPSPNLSKVNTLLLDGTIAQVEKAEEGNSFDYWVRVSTLTSGKPVWVPLRAHSHFNNAVGELANFVQLSFRNDGSLQFVLVKKSDKAPIRTTGEYIGLDWGMKTLFSTSDGRLLGQNVMPHLQELDAQLLTLQKALQAQGISLKTNKRYQALQKRMREYIKNEINRILNKLSHEDITGLVVEKLDFRGKGLSKTLNRLLTRFGRAAVKKKLTALGEDAGLNIVEVNPAYSSQQCSGCGYIHKKNRSGLKFSCRFCGKKSHADINAARIILKRRSLDIVIDSNTANSRETFRQKLDNEFSSYWGYSLPVQDAKWETVIVSPRCPTVQLSRLN